LTLGSTRGRLSLFSRDVTFYYGRQPAYVYNYGGALTARACG
jgi:hypothetical protein